MEANSALKLIRTLLNSLAVVKSQKGNKSEFHQTFRIIFRYLKQCNSTDFESEEVKKELDSIESKDFPVEFGLVLGFILIDLSCMKNSIHPYIFVCLVAGANAFELGLFDVSLGFYSIADEVYEKSHAENKHWHVTVGIKNNLGCLQSLLGGKPNTIELQILVKFEKRKNKSYLYSIVENNLARAHFIQEGIVPRDIIPSYESVLQKISLWSKSKGQHCFANTDGIKIAKSKKGQTHDYKRPSHESQNSPRDERCRSLAIAGCSCDQWPKSRDVKFFSVTTAENSNLPLRMLVDLRNYADYLDQIDTHDDLKDFYDIDLKAFDMVPNGVNVLKVACCSIAVLFVNHGNIKKAEEMNEQHVMDCPTTLNSPSGFIVSKEIALAKIALGQRMAGKTVLDDTIRACNYLYGDDHPIALDLPKTRNNTFSKALTDSPSSLVDVSDLCTYPLPMVVKMFADCDQQLKPDANVWKMLNERVLVDLDCFSREKSPEQPLTLSLTASIFMVSEMLYHMYIDQEIPALIFKYVQNLKEFLGKVVKLSLVGNNVSCLNAMQLSPSYGLYAIAGLCFLLESTLVTNALALGFVCEKLLEVLTCIYDFLDQKLEFYKDFNGQISFYLNFREATLSSGLARLCTVVTCGRRNLRQFTEVNRKEQPLFKTTALQNRGSSLEGKSGYGIIVVAHRSSSLLDIDELRKISQKTLDSIFFQSNGLIECTPSWSDPASRPDLELLKSLPAELEGSAMFYPFEFQKNLTFLAETQPAVLMAVLHHHFKFQVPAEEVHKASEGKMKFFFRRHGLLTLVWEGVNLRLHLKTLCPSPSEVDAMPQEFTEIFDDIVKKCSDTFEVRPVLHTPWHKVQGEGNGFFIKESEGCSQTLLEENFKLRSGNAYLKKMLQDLMKSRQEPQDNNSSFETPTRIRQSVDGGGRHDENNGLFHDATLSENNNISLCSHDFEQTTSLSLDYGMNDHKNGKTNEDEKNHLRELGEAEFRRETAQRNLKRSVLAVQQDVINYKNKKTSQKIPSTPETRSVERPTGIIKSAYNNASNVYCGRHLRADNNLVIKSSSDKDVDLVGQSTVQKVTTFEISRNSSQMQMYDEERQGFVIVKTFDGSGVVEHGKVLELSIDEENLRFPDSTWSSESDTSLESFKSANDGFFDECDAADPGSINVNSRSNMRIIDTQGLFGDENDKEIRRTTRILNEEAISEDEIDEKELFLPPPEGDKTSTYSQNDQHPDERERDSIFEHSTKNRNSLLWVSDNNNLIDQYCLPSVSLKAQNSTDDKDSPNLTTRAAWHETAETRCENVEQIAESCKQLHSRLPINEESVVADGTSTTRAKCSIRSVEISEKYSDETIPKDDKSYSREKVLADSNVLKDGEDVYKLTSHWGQMARLLKIISPQEIDLETGSPAQKKTEKPHQANLDSLIARLCTGKSAFLHTFAREISLDCKKSMGFRFVFLLPYHKLNLFGRKDVQLRGLLNHFRLPGNNSQVIDEPIFEQLLLQANQVLFVFDGFDQYTYRRDILDNYFEQKYPDEPRIPMAVPVIISKILKQRILYGAYVVVTSRTVEAKELRGINVDDGDRPFCTQVKELIEASFQLKPMNKDRYVDHSPSIYEGFEVSKKKFHSLLRELESNIKYCLQDRDFVKTRIHNQNSDEDRQELQGCLLEQQSLFNNQEKQGEELFVPRIHNKNASDSTRHCRFRGFRYKSLDSSSRITHDESSEARALGISQSFLAKHSTLLNHGTLVYRPYMTMPVLGYNSRHTTFSTRQMSGNLVHDDDETGLQSHAFYKSENNDECENKSSLHVAKDIRVKEDEMRTAINLATTLSSCEMYEEALFNAKKCLEISKELTNVDMEMRAMKNIAMAYQELGKYGDAIALYRQCEDLSKKSGDKLMEAHVCMNLSLVFRAKNELNEAIKLAEKSFRLSKMNDDQRMQMNVARTIGSIYRSLDKNQDAINHYRICLEISCEVSDQEMEMLVSRELAAIYESNKQIDEAIACNKRSLDISKELYNKEVELSIATRLASLYQDIDQYNDAIAYKQRCLQIAADLDDKQSKFRIAEDLAKAYASLNEFESARFYQLMILEIAEDLRDRPMEMRIIREIAMLYQKMGKVEDAIANYKRCLEICVELDKEMEMDIHGDLTVIYKQMHLISNAIIHSKRCLEIAEELREMKIVMITAVDLGELYKLSNKFDDAIDMYKRSLEIAIEIGDKRIEVQAARGLATMYKSMENPNDAIVFLERSLAITQEIGDTRQEMQSNNELAEAYKAMGKFELCIVFYEKALIISRRTNDYESEIQTSRNISSIHKTLSEPDNAIAHLKRSVEISKEIGNKEIEMQVSQEIAALSKTTSQYEDAVLFSKRSLLLAKQLGNQQSEMFIYMELGLILKGLNDYPGAIECAKSCHHVASHVCDKNIEMKACLLLIGLYEALGKFDEVFLYGQSCVEIAQETGDKQAELIACLVIGEAYQKMAKMKALPQPTWTHAIEEIDEIFALIQTSIILPSCSCVRGCFEGEDCFHSSEQSHVNLKGSETYRRRIDQVDIENTVHVSQGVIEIVLNADIPTILSEVYLSLPKRKDPVIEEERRLNSLHKKAQNIWNSVYTVVNEHVSSWSTQDDTAANNINTDNGVDDAINAGSIQEFSVQDTGIPSVAAVTAPSIEQGGQMVGDQNACEDEDVETCQINGGNTQSLHQIRGNYYCPDDTSMTERTGKSPVEDYSETCVSVVGEVISTGDIQSDDEIQNTETSDVDCWWPKKAGNVLLHDKHQPGFTSIARSCSNEPTEDDFGPSEDGSQCFSCLPKPHIVTPNSAVHQSTEVNSCCTSEGNNNACHEEVQQPTTIPNVESCLHENTENNTAVSEGGNHCNSNLPTCRVVTSDTGINDPEEDSEMRSLEETVSRIRDSLNSSRSLNVLDIYHQKRENSRRERELWRQRQREEIEQLLEERKVRVRQSNNFLPQPASLPVQISDHGASSCTHFKRGCDTFFPCCGKFYQCHRCHNQSNDCQVTNSKASDATKLRCRTCNTEQEITRDRSHCIHCKRKLSEYFCGICKHYTADDKKPYHCEPCGICRINKDNSFHCNVCNVCLNKRLQGRHKCRANSGHDECCICLEDAFSGCQVLPCSHKVHRECAVAMIKNGVRTCPICRAPIYE